MENFLKRLQDADTATKRRILMFSSAVIMVAVLYVWLAYFNSLLADAGSPAVISTTAGEPSAVAAEVSFLETMKRGTAVLYENVAGAVSQIGEVLKGPREYIVKPSQ
jgi:ABC-type thiamin/hydroxymethylpyrimidine transport system permease subunit